MKNKKMKIKETNIIFISILLSVFVSVFMHTNVNAQTFTEAESTVILQNNQRYTFIYENDTNAENKGTTNFGSITVETEEEHEYTTHGHTEECPTHEIYTTHEHDDECACHEIYTTHEHNDECACHEIYTTHEHTDECWIDGICICDNLPLNAGVKKIYDCENLPLNAGVKKIYDCENLPLNAGIEKIYDCENLPLNDNEEISGYTSIGTVTLTADYLTMNNKDLIVEMGGKSHVWHLTFEDPTAFSTNQPNVELMHGQVYKFTYSNSTNAGNSASSNFGTTSTKTTSSTYSYSESYKTTCSHCHGSGKVSDTGYWMQSGGTQHRKKTCGTCGGKGTKTERRTVTGTSYSSTTTVTLVANYNTMNGKKLTVNMGGQTATWNLTVLGKPNVTKEMSHIRSRIEGDSTKLHIEGWFPSGIEEYKWYRDNKYVDSAGNSRDYSIKLNSLYYRNGKEAIPSQSTSIDEIYRVELPSNLDEVESAFSEERVITTFKKDLKDVPVVFLNQASFFKEDNRITKDKIYDAMFEFTNGELSRMFSIRNGMTNGTTNGVFNDTEYGFCVPCDASDPNAFTEIRVITDGTASEKEPSEFIKTETNARYSTGAYFKPIDSIDLTELNPGPQECYVYFTYHGSTKAVYVQKAAYILTERPKVSKSIHVEYSDGTPWSETSCFNKKLTLSVEMINDGNADDYEYTWYRNTNAITEQSGRGTSFAKLELDPVEDNNAYYYCLIKGYDGGESQTSSIRIYSFDTHKPTAWISRQPEKIEGLRYDNIELFVNAEDKGGLVYNSGFDDNSYLWLHNPSEDVLNNIENCTEWGAKNTYTVTEDGTYYCFVKDKFGNISEVSETIDLNKPNPIIIDDADNTPSVVDISLVEKDGDGNMSLYTRGNYAVITPDNSLLKSSNIDSSAIRSELYIKVEAKDNNGGTLNYSLCLDGDEITANEISSGDVNYLPINQNGIYTLVITDQTGANPIAKTLNVLAFDESLPIIEDIKKETREQATIFTVSAHDEQSGIALNGYQLEYKNDNGIWEVLKPWQTSNIFTIDFTDDIYYGEFRISVRDKAGYVVNNKDSASLIIDKHAMDKIKPSVELNLYNNDGITLWTGENHSLVSSEYTGVSTSEKTNLILELIYSDNDAAAELQITGSELFHAGDASGSRVSITKNGIYSVIVTDSNGNYTEKTVEVNAFDQNAPSIDEISKDNIEQRTVFTVNASDVGSGIDEYGYKLEYKDENNNWVVLRDWQISNKFEIDFNEGIHYGDFRISVRDKAGLVTSKEGDENLIIGQYELDKTAPSLELVTYKEDKATISTDPDYSLISDIYEGETTKQKTHLCLKVIYSDNSDSVLSVTGSGFDEFPENPEDGSFIDITRNGTYTVTVTDGNNNSTIKKIKVNAFDQANPIIEKVEKKTNGETTVFEVTATDSESGIDEKGYRLEYFNNDTWTILCDWQTSNRFNINFDDEIYNGQFRVSVRDKAGRITYITSINDLTISKYELDKTAPKISFNLYKADGITISDDGNYSLISDIYNGEHFVDTTHLILEILYSDNSDAPLSVTGGLISDEIETDGRFTEKSNGARFNITQNGKYSLTVIDGNNNVATKEIIIKAFDEENPQVTSITRKNEPDIEGITSYSSIIFDITASDSESGIGTYAYKMEKKELLGFKWACYRDWQSSNKFILNKDDINYDGTYRFLIKDNAGRITVCENLINNGVNGEPIVINKGEIDSNPPVIKKLEIISNEDDRTKINVKVTAEDNESKSDNLKYMIFDIDDIQSVDLSPTSTAWEKGSSIKDSDGNYILSVTEPSEERKTGTRIYYVYVSDEAGLCSYSGINIDFNKYTGNFFNSEELTVNNCLSITPDTWTNTDVAIHFNSSKDLEDFEFYLFKEGDEISISPEGNRSNYEIVGKNGNYFFELIDTADDSFKAVYKTDVITITNIDKNKPSLILEDTGVEGVSITATEPLNESGIAFITVESIEDDSCSIIQNFNAVDSFGTGPAVGTLSFTFPKTGSYKITAYDVAGNSISKTKSAVVIEDAPAVDEYAKANLTNRISVSTRQWTNQKVKLTFDKTGLDLTEKPYKWVITYPNNEGTEESQYTNSNEKEISKNGDVKIIVRDIDGNEHESNIVIINNIDTIKPELEASENEDGISYINVLAKDSISGIKEVKVQGGLYGENPVIVDMIYKDQENYNGSIYTLGAGEYKVTVTDYAGNSTTSTVQVTRDNNELDRYSADWLKAIITKSPWNWTNQKVTLSTVISLIDEIGRDESEKEISSFAWVIDGQSDIENIASIEVPKNTTVRLKVTKVDGTEVYSNPVEITNIDTSGIKINDSQKDSIISAKLIDTNDSDVNNISGIKIVKILKPDGSMSVLGDYRTAGDTFEGVQVAYKCITNGDYKIIAEDVAGNTTESKTITITNAINQSPWLTEENALEEITKATRIYPTSWTNGNVTIEINPSSKKGLAYYPYSFDEGKTWINWNNCNVVKNGRVHIWIRDISGTIYKGRVDITNIDRDKPELSVEGILENVLAADIKITAQDNTSGIDKITIQGGEFNSEIPITSCGNAPSYSGKFKVYMNGTYTIKVYDAAGNNNSNTTTITGITGYVEPEAKEKIVEIRVPEVKNVTVTETVPVEKVSYIDRWNEVEVPSQIIPAPEIKYIQSEEPVSKIENFKENIPSEKQIIEVPIADQGTLDALEEYKNRLKSQTQKIAELEEALKEAQNAASTITKNKDSSVYGMNNGVSLNKKDGKTGFLGGIDDFYKKLFGKYATAMETFSLILLVLVIIIMTCWIYSESMSSRQTNQNNKHKKS